VFNSSSFSRECENNAHMHTCTHAMVLAVVFKCVKLIFSSSQFIKTRIFSHSYHYLSILQALPMPMRAQGLRERRGQGLMLSTCIALSGKHSGA
jgi:hypothetical protein